MCKDATVHSRIDGIIKSKAERILKRVGLGPSDAIDIFYRQIIFHNGIPFPIEIPNEETLQAIKELENGKGITKYDSVDELIESLKA